MAVVRLQTSNVFSYSFPNPGNTHFHFIQINNQPALNLSGGNWTVECWIKPTGDYTGFNTIFTKRLSGTGTCSYEGFLQQGTGTISYYNGTVFNSTTRLTGNVWSHVAWVFNNTANLQMYLNGTRVHVAAVTSTTEVDTEISIGNARGLLQGFKGQISNFRMIKGQAIYTNDFQISSFPVNLPNNAIGPATGNVAGSLTGNVVLLTCNEQTIRANGNVNHNLYVSGVVTPQVIDTTELQNFSYFFPGNASSRGQNGTVIVASTTNSLNLNTDFTIETWFYPQTNTGVLLERGYAGVGNNSASYILLWDTPNNNINFAVANANNVAYSVGSLTGAAGSLGAPTINAWNHIAVTRAGNTYRGFLNGALTFTPGTNANTPYAALGRGITIGGMFNNGQTYSTGIPSNTISGFISNLRVIRGNSVYNAAFTPARTQLPNVTNTILLTALTPVFQDLIGSHVIAANGMDEITFSTFSPFTANAVANANATTAILVNPASGGEQGKIYNKFDYQNFGQVINIYPALGFRQGRIYNKFDYQSFGQMVNIYPALGFRQGRIYDKIESAEFVMSVPIYNALGQDQGRIYDKIESAEFAYIPTGGVGGPTGNIEYQFWS